MALGPRAQADHESLDHAAPLISLLRERGHGRVVIDPDGNSVTQYPVTNELDIRDIRAGVEHLVRLHEAAGAETIIASHRKAGDWERGDDLEAFIEMLNAQRHRLHDAPFRR